MTSIADYGRRGVLVGRQAERARIDAVIEDARAGRNRTLVVRGEPGIGKTSLLRYAAHTATRMTVLQTQGVPSEARLAFAALSDICRPLLAKLEDLPLMQADALRAALGIHARVFPDALSVGAATLSLLAAAAEHEPVLVLIDDAQWVDDASAAALFFAARRLQADAVAIIFAERDTHDPVGNGAFEELNVGRLTRADAAALLADVDVDASVADRLYHATAGNPLALVELPKLLTQAQLSGEEALAEPLPVGIRVQRAFSSRINELSNDERLALVIVAATSSRDQSIVLEALAAAGIQRSALERAEDASLLRLSNTSVDFRHPLVRATVHAAAPPSERRQAHKWLAAAFADTGDRERAAWHLAAAALGPDEHAAQALEDVAHATWRRGAPSVAADAFRRAAELTADRPARDQRLADAAGAYWAAGDAQQAIGLLDDVIARVSAPASRAERLALRGNIEHRIGNSVRAIRLLTDAADLLAAADNQASLPILADAFEAALQAGQTEHCSEIAARIAALDDAGRDHAFYSALAGGVAALNAGDHVTGETLLAHAAELVAEGLGPSLPRHVHWDALAAAWLNRHGEARRLTARAIATLREDGRISELPEALRSHAIQELHLGNGEGARAAITESLTLADQTGQPVNTGFAHATIALVAAISGDDAVCRASAHEAIAYSETLGRVQLRVLAERPIGLLALGNGRHEEAVDHLRVCRAAADAAGLRWQHVPLSADLVEALVRAGHEEEARDAAAEIPLPGLPNERAVYERTQALLAKDDFEPHFVSALESHAEGYDAFEHARTEFCFGERLRRSGRKQEARTQLRSALRKFEALAARPWIVRARAELTASGDASHQLSRVTTGTLTPQELQVALHVAKGLTNREVAGALFLSPKTIEFHLTRVYRKLDVRSRAELVRVLVADEWRHPDDLPMVLPD